MNTLQHPSTDRNPVNLPPPIRTSDPDSFAYGTFTIRVPKVIDDVIAANDFPIDVQEAMIALRNEVTDGVICGLQENTDDKAFWDMVSQEAIGRPWTDVIWFWAETFFYRRILEATRYFQPGPMQGVDPFEVIKATELIPDAAPRLLNTVLNNLPNHPETRFQQLLYASLWGNRIDLSYNVAGHLSNAENIISDTANLLIDDSTVVWHFLQRQAPCRIALIADNAGTEFSMDLALMDFLLGQSLASQIDLYLKPQPFFISDVMPKDVDIGLEALRHGGSQSNALQKRIHNYLDDERLRLLDHWFFPSSLFYYQMPDDLHQALGEADIVFIKGDANYRRLLGDAHWPVTTPFADITAYFPAPHVALRTLKAEIIVGLDVGVAEQLQTVEPDWKVSGKRGVIQGRIPII